jgi:hypothetical protein
LRQVDLLCLDPQAAPGAITVILLNPRSSMPILQAQLRMPVSDLETGE